MKKEQSKTARVIALICFAPLGAVVGWIVATAVLNMALVEPLEMIYIQLIKIAGAILMALVFMAFSSLFLRGLNAVGSRIERGLSKYPAKVILMGLIGLLIGVVLAVLIALVLSMAISESLIKTLIYFVLVVLFGVLGLRIGARLLPDVLPATNLPKPDPSHPRAESDVKVLDASALIDGRILDIVRTGFASGLILIPSAVLTELSRIADSDDVLKKNRGKRGLDITAALQKEKNVTVRISDAVAQGSVDDILLKEAEDCKGKLVTSDSNLGKLAVARNIEVLNINDLSNAIKPIALPGEKMRVRITKEGKERGQGVAFAPDGTMIVVENGGSYIGQDCNVTVTTSLQTAAGRIIFVRI